MYQFDRAKVHDQFTTLDLYLLNFRRGFISDSSMPNSLVDDVAGARVVCLFVLNLTLILIVIWLMQNGFSGTPSTRRCLVVDFFFFFFGPLLMALSSCSWAGDLGLSSGLRLNYFSLVFFPTSLVGFSFL